MTRLLPLLLSLAVLLSSSPSGALSRPLWRVREALREAAPHLSPKSVDVYARIVREEARSRSFDPYTLIAMVRFESGWSSGVVGRNSVGTYVGFGQIRLENWRECRGEEGPSSEACARRRRLLRDPVFNLRRTARFITEHRTFCRKKTGEPALFARWLSSYQGFNNSSKRRGVWCNMRQDRRGRWRDVRAPTFTRKVIAYRRQLARRFR